MSDDVMDLLESLDSQPKDKKTKKTRKPREKKDNADIMGFLDDLARDSKDVKEGEETPEPACTKQELASYFAGTDTSIDKDPISSGPHIATVSGAADSADSTTSALGTAPAGALPAADAPKDPEVDPLASLTSWWSKNKGGLWDSAQNAANAAALRASGAVKQAEARVAELQAELKTEQPSGFGLGNFSKGLTSVLHTIVPPISRHEQLTIHIFHDMVGYPNIDELVHTVFSRVMDQVEGGGDLNMIVQKGQERHRAGSNSDVQRSLNAIRGSFENGRKLAVANIESLQTSKDSAKKLPYQISELFVSIQPVISVDENPNQSTITTNDPSFYFVVYLSDPEHNIQLTTTSQAFPVEWAEWLDKDDSFFVDKIADTRDWVLDWVEDGLHLAVGVVAQKYVTLRMGLQQKPSAP